MDPLPSFVGSSLQFLQVISATRWHEAHFLGSSSVTEALEEDVSRAFSAGDKESAALAP